ncbi:MAG TPA: hypothetical protein V6C72_00085, partial [Chroococcales cyanobacterium]
LLSTERSSQIFTIRLQIELPDSHQWVTIAAYESMMGRITRRTDKSDGSRNYLDVALPAPVARQMAREDFTRNWQRYLERFLSDKSERAQRTNQSSPANRERS